jgi:hypothetical protein
MRRLPKQVRLLGQRITVGLVPELTHAAEDEQGDLMYHAAYGIFSPQEPVIWLDSENGSERMKATFLHEVLHAAIDISHQSIDDEEVVVGMLAPLLLDFIRANKAAVAYLQES